MNAIVPMARCAVTVRPAVAGDYPFIDRLQDMHSKALGFMRKAALEGKIAAGQVLVAEATSVDCGMLNVDRGQTAPFQQSTINHQQSPVGYCISSDRYFKRDELGIVYQMNVVPGAQRKLVAATLLKAVFERAPYGCRLFCCWCAQDLDANYFWESMGFIPLAFRTGASGKRTHIFWQRRIREGDTTTPYWYPSKTDGGMMREDRLVLPIPPGVHWKDKMPILLPGVAGPSRPCLPGKKDMAETAMRRKNQNPPTLMPPTRRGARFGPPSAGAEPEPTGAVVEKPKPQKPKREKVKADPAHVAAARELRDRYLEQFNSGLVLPNGKYEVSRTLSTVEGSKALASPSAKPMPLLETRAA